MHRVNLDSFNETTKSLVLAFALEPGGSVLEMNGEAVAWVVPATDTNGKDEPWTEQKNQRRCDLIDRKYSLGLTPAEAIELARLQDAVSRHAHRVAPLPIEEARRLHQELLNKAAHAGNSE